MDLVNRVNRLLRSRKPFTSLDELLRISASLVVLLYEQAFRDDNDIRDLVRRKPELEREFVYNATLVVDGLKARFGAHRLRGVSGEGLNQGDPNQLNIVLELFERMEDDEHSRRREALSGPLPAEDSFESQPAAATASSSFADNPVSSPPPPPPPVSDFDDFASTSTDNDVWWDHERHADEFAPLEELGMRFPENARYSRVKLSALRALARHRTEASLNTQPGRALKENLSRDKGRFRQAYESFLNDERRESRLAAQRQALKDKLTRERDAHERKVERLRLQRLGEDLAREAAARRARRKSREEQLVRSMFSEAFDVERERILASRALQAHEQHLRDKALLQRYEAAKQAAQDRLDMLQEELEEDKQRTKALRNHQQGALNRLNKELKQDLAARMERLRAELDSSEAERFEVNAAGIERAFALLHDNAREFIKL